MAFNPATMTCLVVDDHQIVRSGVRTVLLDAFADPDSAKAPRVVEAETVRSAIEFLGSEDVDLAIIDLRLPDGSGIDVLRYIYDNDLAAASLILTSVPTPRALLDAHEWGAAGFVSKTDTQPLLRSVVGAANGMTSISKEDVKAARAEIEGAGAIDLETLTKRNREIVELVADGMTNDEIAEAMFLSAQTIANRLSDIYKRLGVSGGRSGLVAAFHKNAEKPA